MLTTDIVKWIGEIIQRLIQIPGETRQEYRDVIDETMETLDSALLIVIKRLSDLLNIATENRSEFVKELSLIRDPYEWAAVERSVRLCGSLRGCSGEMYKLFEKFKGKIAGIDEDFVMTFLSQLFNDERTLAEFIVMKLKVLADMAEEANKSQEGFDKAVDEVNKVRDAFRTEQRILIRKQIEFYDKFS